MTHSRDSGPNFCAKLKSSSKCSPTVRMSFLPFGIFLWALWSACTFGRHCHFLANPCAIPHLHQYQDVLSAVHLSTPSLTNRNRLAGVHA